MTNVQSYRGHMDGVDAWMEKANMQARAEKAEAQRDSLKVRNGQILANWDLALADKQKAESKVRDYLAALLRIANSPYADNAPVLRGIALDAINNSEQK